MSASWRSSAASARGLSSESDATPMLTVALTLTPSAVIDSASIAARIRSASRAPSELPRTKITNSSPPNRANTSSTRINP